MLILQVLFHERDDTSAIAPDYRLERNQETDCMPFSQLRSNFGSLDKTLWGKWEITGNVSLQWVWPSSQSDGVAGDERALQDDALACGSPAAVGGGTTGHGGGKVVSGRGAAPSTHLLCHLCGYVAQRRQHLETHVRTHTGERPHQCPHCKYKCSDLSNLKKHIRIHSGEKPFACPHCPFRSGESSSLKKHIRKLHAPDNSVQPQDAFAMTAQPTYSWQDSAM